MNIRKKHQRFGILDSSSLLATDLAALPGPFGRALIYFSLNRFQALCAGLSDDEIENVLLLPVHKFFRNAAIHVGYSYASGINEYVLLLPNVSESVAWAFAESLLDELKGLSFEGPLEGVEVTGTAGAAWQTSSAICDLARKAHAIYLEALEPDVIMGSGGHRNFAMMSREF